MPCTVLNSLPRLSQVILTTFFVGKYYFLHFEDSERLRGAWLAQSVEHATLDLGVMSLSPTLGVDITKK